jgi:hypothetical protein
MPLPTGNDVFTLRDLVGMSEDDFAAFVADVQARRRKEAERVETVQRAAAASAAKMVTAPDDLRKQKEWGGTPGGEEAQRNEGAWPMDLARIG